MNTPDDNTDNRDNGTWESEMGDEFERRVRNLHEAPLDLSSVKGKAMKIQRNRRAAIAGGILAAAAVIVPVAVIATSSSNDRAGTIDPAGPSVTISDTANPTPSPSPTAVDPSTDPSTPGTLPDGPALGFDYVEAGSGNAILHQRDGGVVELPGPDYTGAATLGDQIAALRRDDQGNTAVDLVEGGQVVRTYDLRGGMTIAPDGRTVAFITTDDELLFVNGEVGEQSFGRIDQGVSLSAIVGNGDCVLESGCHPFLEYDNFEEGEAFEINYEGPNSTPAPGARRVNDAEGFLVSVLTEATDTGSCGGLYDREGGGKWVFETCDAQVLDISPTGEYVVGTDPYGDGLGPGYFNILDRNGQEVARYDSDRGFVFLSTVWTDDGHVVAPVYENGQWKVVSLGVDGSVEVVLGPVDGSEMLNPFMITG